MHKGIILLVKAESLDAASGDAEHFLEDYYNDVYDWYQIGGRWSGMLAGDGKGDIVPLSSCLDVLKEWEQKVTEVAEQFIVEAAEWEAKGKLDMKGHMLKKAGQILCQDFSNECNVFNIEAYNYSVPEDPEGWWAVMLDIHH